MPATLDPELLRILACPQCKGTLDYRAAAAALDCARCALRYRVEEGVPIMLVSEATPLEAGPGR
jgi:uncharacterized protein YbaR (Trm112 family)